MRQRARLGVNIDHVATVRNARGGTHPDPVRAAEAALAAGADGITAHLREDRRHITDGDIDVLSALCARAGKPLNLEMAVTEEMLAIALRHRPHAACLVPERREERGRAEAPDRGSVPGRGPVPGRDSASGRVEVRGPLGRVSSATMCSSRSCSGSHPVPERDGAGPWSTDGVYGTTMPITA